LKKTIPGWKTMGDAKRSFVKSGLDQFRKFSKDTMNLGRAQRVHPSQVVLSRILEGIRGEDMEAYLTQEDAELLCSYHLRDYRFTDEDKKFIKDNSLWLFANKAARNNHNSQKIKQLHSKDNPVAKIKALTTSNGKVKKNDRHFDADRTPPCVNLCRDARVEITGVNYEPGWGLYHGSIGTVQDIVFSDTCSPNNGDMPDYVLVEFPQYCGPAFVEHNPKLIPIVPVDLRCDMGCCKRRYVPLKPAFGKTCHTFQGQNAGPVLENQPANTVLRIVCDPGNRGFEGINPGLFYTLMSRATTLGTPDDVRSSAIYFCGDDMTPGRVLFIDRKKEGGGRKLYDKAELRSAWVSQLKRGRHRSGIDEAELETLFKFFNETRLRCFTIEGLISTLANGE
jgi:hypothetical protein